MNEVLERPTVVEEIIVAAEGVRCWAEFRAMGTENAKDLNGWCAIATAQLWRQLKVSNPNIQAEIWMARNGFGAHVYLVVDDLIVDTTATQFTEKRHEPIVVVHEKEVDHLWYYKKTERFATPEALLKFQKKNRWPKEQQAYGSLL